MLKIFLSLLALSGIASSSYIFFAARSGHDDKPHEARYVEKGWSNESGRHQSGNDEGGNHGGVHGAPGPIAGAGLPVIAVGYGVYWLMRRRRKTD
ncbi:hypothetical protein [Bradyrhizobium sp. ARR65]|uniref:hypothetical protein n=1 Tax=Bradyrhizobium sp. ARR65 TaxID=1040989 RepID=UPI000A854570|nr:hypothetical protein [Bradyrhizobium sp. ARR65]